MADDDSTESLFACQAENEADSAPQIISRADAIALGFVTYFTGKPCKNNHISERRVDNSDCLECVAIRRKKHYEDHKEVYIERAKQYNKNNPEKACKATKKWKVANRDNYLEQQKLAAKERRLANPEKAKQQDKIYRENNHEKVLQHNKNWKNNNKEHIRAYNREQLKTNLDKRLRTILRARLNSAVRDNYKAGSAVRDLGCSIAFFKEYIAKQFKDGMTWENWGKVWHIDHIEPLCSFDLEDREQFLKMCHYTNMQPLLIKDNLAKISEDKKKSIKKAPYAPSDELQALFEDENPAKE